MAKPQQFDVMVMPNLYGNIVANVCTGLVGGAGLVAGSNYGKNVALFEAGTRNSGKGIAGQNTANPSGMLLTAANMLDYLGYIFFEKLKFFIKFRFYKNQFLLFIKVIYLIKKKFWLGT